eukprot:CAMPEP_0118852540 /NCGR_PEP_ID=MMETSP1163-20130328/1502_1 /TAXON_ID=124430 /ORGANISM="Phaeomonas parva, Strain CCMP2877" /LENGTH=145 /DNA_ID=CAMNT_0006784977 /DNA_START=152 /DNA_END=585 /DNA_ORIENTATION=+
MALGLAFGLAIRLRPRLGCVRGIGAEAAAGAGAAAGEGGKGDDAALRLRVGDRDAVGDGRGGRGAREFLRHERHIVGVVAEQANLHLEGALFLAAVLLRGHRRGRQRCLAATAAAAAAAAAAGLAGPAGAQPLLLALALRRAAAV